MSNVLRLKTRVASWSFSKHQWLAFIGGVSLLIWGISALTHIWMVLFGPQQNVFMPPTSPIMMKDTRPISDILFQAGIDRTIAVKTVPSATGTLYQVTTSLMDERRYFLPSSGEELQGQDSRQAEYLARHYLKEGRPVTSVSLQREFDEDYPWVNRLLPVWVVRFAGEDGLVAYIHTETGSLAAVNNNMKVIQQRVFRWLHNWDWIPSHLNWLRMVIITGLVGSLAALSITGFVMLVTIRRSQRIPGIKGWHRLAGYVLALPLLMFSASGIYHLVQFSIEPPVSQFQMPKPLKVTADRYPIDSDWYKITQGRSVRSISLVEGPEGQPLYRLDMGEEDKIMNGEHDHHAHSDATPKTPIEIRKARFDGKTPGREPMYIDVASGAVLPMADRDMALSIASRYTGSDMTAKDVSLITRFGNDYDFRNKRLPVWRVDFGEPLKASIFVDTATGALVDRVFDWQKPERWVFSLIHKWNFLFPLGKINLNIIVAIIIVGLISLMALIGLFLDMKRRQNLRGKIFNI